MKPHVNMLMTMMMMRAQRFFPIAIQKNVHSIRFCCRRRRLRVEIKIQILGYLSSAQLSAATAC